MSQFFIQLMPWIMLAFGSVSLLRLILGPTLGDRLVALNVLSGLALGFLVIQGVLQGRALYLDVALVYDIFGFLGFLALAHFLKKKDE
jgi:multicomponent Na+:H+ antiporter subunit F